MKLAPFPEPLVEVKGASAGGGGERLVFDCKLHRCSKYVNSCVFLAAPKVSSPMLRMQFS
jgi:hypothetical protein